MDALYRLLVEQYKMDPAKAQKYADLIHKEHGNPDNLQTEAYSKAAGSQADFDRADGGGAVADNALGNMAKLKNRAELFTQLHRRVQAGEQLDPAHQKYYGQVMALHQQKVRDNANKQVATAGANQIVQQAGQMQQQVRGIGDRAREMQGGGPDPMRMQSGESVGQRGAVLGAYHAGEGGGIPLRGVPRPQFTPDFSFEAGAPDPMAEIYNRMMTPVAPTFAPPVDLPMLGQGNEAFRQAAQDAYTKGRK